MSWIGDVADVEVNNCYMKHYTQVFKPTEVQMMLAAFSNMETIHIAAYSHLLDTIGMPVDALLLQPGLVSPWIIERFVRCACVEQ